MRIQSVVVTVVQVCGKVEGLPHGGAGRIDVLIDV